MEPRFEYHVVWTREHGAERILHDTPEAASEHATALKKRAAYRFIQIYISVVGWTPTELAQRELEPF